MSRGENAGMRKKGGVESLIRRSDDSYAQIQVRPDIFERTHILLITLAFIFNIWGGCEHVIRFLLRRWMMTTY